LQELVVGQLFITRTLWRCNIQFGMKT
jgi:hypothetical protein